MAQKALKMINFESFLHFCFGYLMLFSNVASSDAEGSPE